MGFILYAVRTIIGRDVAEAAFTNRVRAISQHAQTSKSLNIRGRLPLISSVVPFLSSTQWMAMHVP